MKAVARVANRLMLAKPCMHTHFKKRPVEIVNF